MEPWSALSPSQQNARAFEFPARYEASSPGKVSVMATAPISPPDSPNQPEDQPDFQYTSSPPRPSTSHSVQSSQSVITRSPIKYRLQADDSIQSSPPGSPAESTVRFNEGLTRAIGDMQRDTESPDQGQLNTTVPDEGMSTIYHSPTKSEEGDQTEITIDLGTADDRTGDLSTISAIPADMTQFATRRISPLKMRQDAWSPSKQLQGAVMATPGQPRPLLLGRSSTGSVDGDETPRRPRSDNSPTDLLNFTGQTNILIPPPDSAPRTSRRSPSGRIGFPIKVASNPTPSHRSQASVDREQSVLGRSARRSVMDRPVPSTPAGSRHSMYGAPNGFGMDLLDIDLEPMATPRSIPTVTPRELESLRSEMQSRISGLEATLSGKEAEVMALKRAITEAEVRAGKVSEELRTEQSEKQALVHHAEEMERQNREMEDVMREIKQNAFMEEREREKLRRQIEDAERKADEQEVKILELNASLATLSSDRVRNSPNPHAADGPNTPGSAPLRTTADVDAAVKNATETVARELHALYKSKHERKVSDLKVSYEKRWIKQVDQLKADLEAARDQINGLQNKRVSGGPENSSAQVQVQSEQMSRMQGQIEELRRFNEETTVEKKNLETEVAGLQNTVEATKKENDSLRKEVEIERAEKGELVAQVEVFLQVSAEQEKEIGQARQREREREKEKELEAERERQRIEEESRSPPRRLPVSPPRSDSDASSTTSSYLVRRPSSSLAMSTASPNRYRNSVGTAPPLYSNGAIPTSSAVPAARARPMSMLQKPAAGKFAGSGIPPPALAASGLKAPSRQGFTSYTPAARGGLMDNITRMGARS